MLQIDRIGVPPALLSALKHAASLHNPEFYEKERLRFSTWNTPRFIRCYRETLDQLLLPRGLRDKADDIVHAVATGRNCLVLTRWTEHLESLASALEERNLEPLLLHGKMGKKARSAVITRLADPPPDGGMLLAATASLLGEGFDCPPLDTLFLAFPIKFKGNVVQYVGRVLRPTDTKTRVEVHDYVDIAVPVLTRQHDERRKAHAALGFDLPDPRPRRARRAPGGSRS